MNKIRSHLSVCQGLGCTMCVTASCSWGSVAWRSMSRNMLQTKRRRRCSRISTVWLCARRNTGTVPRLYAKESVKTRLSFMKEKSSPVLKRVSLKRTRRWGSDSFKSLELVSLAALLCSPLKQPSSSL